MNKIEFPRTSYDGTLIDKAKLQKWYCNQIKGNIAKRLNRISTSTGKGTLILELIKRNLERIILFTPEYLEYVVSRTPKGVFRRKNKGQLRQTNFCKEILEAFNYNSYRKGILVELAQKLNVKSCPYCNMSYSLFATDGKRKLAKLQFDHFFDKSDYPFLSMSLYNLIPSCPVCNQGKSTGHLSLKFHPYKSSISDQFHFRVVNPLELFEGAKIDKIEIELVGDGSSKNELQEYDDMFHVKSLYQRHRDVTQEVFDKAYQEKYYLNNPFTFMDDKCYRLRLSYSAYINESDIEKRPMSKFIQDIRKQALSRKKH
jgi:hypothetical protein